MSATGLVEPMDHYVELSDKLTVFAVVSWSSNKTVLHPK